MRLSSSSLAGIIILCIVFLFSTKLCESRKLYTTTQGICYDCGFGEGKPYQWCWTGDDNWGYCSTRADYSTRNKKCKSNHPCDKHGYSYYWCYLEEGSWDYCSLVSETSAPINKGTKGICIDCGFHSKSYQWCWTNQNEWTYCSTELNYSSRNKKCRSDHACGYHSYDYLWCYLQDGGGWDYCSLIYNEPDSDIDTTRNENDRGGDWSATLYEKDRHGGMTLDLHGTGTQCIALTKEQLCSRSSCIPASGRASSISTHGSCLRLFRTADCTSNHVELRPGTDCHYQWSAASCRIQNEIHSIGGCLRNGTSPDTRVGRQALTNVTPSSTWTAILYEDSDFSGRSAQLKANLSHCVNLRDHKLCDSRSNCTSSADSIVSSLDTDGTCITVFSESDCKVNIRSLVIEPGTDCHAHLSNCRFDDEIKSIRGCLKDPAQIEQIDMHKFRVINSNSPFAQEAFNTYPPKVFGYRKDRPNEPIDLDDLFSAAGTELLDVAIYIHGFATATLNDGVEMKAALYNGAHDVDIIVLFDWRRWSLPADDSNPNWPPNYKIVVTENLPNVARYYELWLLERQRRFKRIHLIGFSLGGQMAGMIARGLKKVTGSELIARISAIDPAGPIFEYGLNLFPVDTTHTLRVTDAPFIDVIHASTVLGMVKPAGHVDVYMEECDCTMPSCTHHKAVELYIASVITCSLITCPAGNATWRTGPNNEQHWMCQAKDPAQISSLGYLSANYKGRGRQEIKMFKYVRRQKVSTGDCSTFMNVNLPAKSRICVMPPNVDAEHCRNSPYLSECGTTCANGFRTLQCTTQGLGLRSEENGVRTLGVQDPPPVNWNGNGRPCALRATCRNPEGTEVPYFVVYKPPGTQFYYAVDNTHTHNTFTWMGDDDDAEIDASNSYLGQTLSAIYETQQGTPGINYLMWNDEKPNNTAPDQAFESAAEESEDDDDAEILTSSYAHSKGVIGFDSYQGFLVTHSVPGFPYHHSKGFKYPRKNVNYAQTAICISLPDLNSVLQILTNIGKTKPQAYASHVLTNITQDLQVALNQILQPPSRMPKPGGYIFEALGNTGFDLHVAVRARREVLDDVFLKIAATYTSNLLVQAWVHHEILPSKCDAAYSIENINEVTVGTHSWTKTQEHGKWIVSKERNPRSVACVGDLNHATSTINRGGLFLCTKHPNIVNAFKAINVGYESCTNRA